MRRKGINLPDTDLAGDILTPKDLKDIVFGAQRDIDYVALSFVQTAQDIEQLKALLKQHGSKAKVIAKIETKAAILEDNLAAIIKASDAVMVARGDLAIEVGAEVVPILQHKILALAQKYGKISIVATQMLISMVEHPHPSRAEVSDIANAVMDGADCLMLSDETANGKYPIEVVATMKRIILYTQEQAPVRLQLSRPGDVSMQTAISIAAISLAQQLKVRAIVCETKTGATVRSVATQRPNMPIISVTSDVRVAQQATLLYATKSFLRPDGEHSGYGLAKELRQEDFFEPNTTVVIVSGRQPGLIGGTDTIRVRVLE
jgi:pyruvate kinase